MKATYPMMFAATVAAMFAISKPLKNEMTVEETTTK